MKYYIVSGEASGDLHGSNLVKELRKLDAHASIRCWGGDLMEAAGATLVKHYKEFAIMGFIEVLKNAFSIMHMFNQCKEDIIAFRPDVLILIDFPGFNLRIASWAKKQGIPVIYYISPQIWAWNQSRVKIIKNSVDKLISIIPFETQFYSKHGYHVDYVGHPLLDVIPEMNGNSHTKEPLIALLPGSRKQEIKYMLPVMTSIIPHFPNYSFVVAGIGSIEKEYYQRFMKYDCPILFDQTYSILARSKAALVTSGTATLETALMNVPFIVCYKSSFISYQIARKLIQVPYISLVNLILNKPAVHELIQDQLTTENLTKMLSNILHNEEIYMSMIDDFLNLRKMLGEKGASQRAACIIVDFLKNRTYVGV